MKLQDIIDRALRKHRNMLEPALEESLQLVLADKKLVAELLQESIRIRIEMLIRQRYSQQRNNIWNAPSSIIAGDPRRPQSKSASKPTPEYIASLNQMYQRSLLNMPLSGGKLLREATRTDIQAELAIYAPTAHTFFKKSVFFYQILKLMPDDIVKVGDVIDDYKAKNLHSIAEKSLPRLEKQVQELLSQ